MNPLGALALAFAFVGCTATPSPTPTTRMYPDLAVNNATTIAVTLQVNGTVLETVGPGTVQDPVPVPMPGLPWQIEARSPSGRLLTSLTITTTTYVDATVGTGRRVDLSCGQLVLWSGPPANGGPAAGSGSPGDCG